MYRALKCLLVGFPLACLPLIGCAAPVGAAGRSIPADTGQTCASECSEVGMQLTGIVTMAGTVGCVCQPRGAAMGQGQYTAAVGGTAALIQQEQQRQQQQQQQQQYRH